MAAGCCLNVGFFVVHAPGCQPGVPGREAHGAQFSQALRDVEVASCESHLSVTCKELAFGVFILCERLDM